jgi:hypothetical protein
MWRLSSHIGRTEAAHYRSFLRSEAVADLGADFDAVWSVLGVHNPAGLEGVFDVGLTAGSARQVLPRDRRGAGRVPAGCAAARLFATAASRPILRDAGRHHVGQGRPRRHAIHLRGGDR